MLNRFTRGKGVWTAARSVRHWPIAILTLAIAACDTSAALGQCRSGDLLLGETTDSYICEHPGNWSKGRWVAKLATANVLGGCVQTWACQPAETMMLSSTSRIKMTGAQNTRGTCSISTANPEECGTCNALPPAASCKLCVEPQECSNPALGTRTRQALGCCS